VRPAVIYFAVLCMALFADIERNLGWRPPFIRVWDVRAAIYFAFLCWWVALVAGVGLSNQLPSEKLPLRFRGMPSLIVMLSVFAVLGAGLRLSPASAGEEVFSNLSLALMIGLGGGVACGFVSSFGSGKDTKPLAGKRLHVFAAIAIVGALAIASILLIPEREVDNGKFETVAEFGGPDLSLTLGIEQPPVGGPKFGVLKIREGEAVNALILERDEWVTLSGLWSKAKGTEAGPWRPIGEMHDTEPSDPTHLDVSAGQGIRLALSSQRGPSLSFELPLADIQRFDAAIRQIDGRLPD